MEGWRGDGGEGWEGGGLRLEGVTTGVGASCRAREGEWAGGMIGGVDGFWLL